MRAMWLMLQQDAPDDYVVATGETHSVRRFCEVAFGHVGLNWEDHVVVDEAFYRPAEVDLLDRLPREGRRAARVGPPTVGFEDLVTMMVDADLALLSGKLDSIS
ncbi:MAG: GDP-mannose 4,6-dehydratase [Microthrixaceae bacterium]